MKQFNRKYCSGISLAEIMIGIAVGAILLTMAGMSMKNSSARTEIEATTDVVVQAFRSAKQAAVLANTSVTAEIKLADDNSGYIITFAFADHQDGDENVNQAKNGLRLVDIELSDRILVSSNYLVYTFDPLGMVDKSGIITLVSTLDSDYESMVVVNSTIEYVTSSFSNAMEKAS